ncbi:MAG: hypothetical protein V7L25_33460 [Nostoc sp.]|uniref:hypothetical protein n=1 Tax=Nostoc sp. TaxID=1180 RepID=UPI002FF1EBB9
MWHQLLLAVGQRFSQVKGYDVVLVERCVGVARRRHRVTKGGVRVGAGGDRYRYVSLKKIA